MSMAISSSTYATQALPPQTPPPPAPVARDGDGDSDGSGASTAAAKLISGTVGTIVNTQA